METKEIFEYIQYLDRICDYYEPKMISNYGNVVTENQAKAQKAYNNADVKRKDLIEILESRVYDEINVLLQKKHLDDMSFKVKEITQKAKEITKTLKNKSNAKKTKKESL